MHRETLSGYDLAEIIKKKCFFIGNSDEKQNKRKEVMLCLSAVCNNAGPTCEVALSSEEDRREEN